MDNVYEETLMACGYCEGLCSEQDVIKHKCLQIFDNFEILSESNTFWGADEHGAICYELNATQWKTILAINKTTSDSLYEKEELNSNCKKRKANQIVKSGNKSLISTKLEQEEKLIGAVHERPELWNITLPLPQRTKAVKEKMWDSVSDELDGSFTAYGAKNKFKNLVDTYRNILRNEHCSSGSARKNSGTNWAHYDSMSFMRSQLCPRKTTGNCDQENSDSEEEESSCRKEFASQRKKRKGCSKSIEEPVEISNSFQKIANAIQESSKDNRYVEVPKLNEEQEEADVVAKVVAFQLKKIQPQYKAKACQEILNFSFNILQKYSKND